MNTHRHIYIYIYIYRYSSLYISVILVITSSIIMLNKRHLKTSLSKAGTFTHSTRVSQLKEWMGKRTDEGITLTDRSEQDSFSVWCRLRALHR